MLDLQFNFRRAVNIGIATAVAGFLAGCALKAAEQSSSASDSLAGSGGFSVGLAYVHSRSSCPNPHIAVRFPQLDLGAHHRGRVHVFDEQGNHFGPLERYQSPDACDTYFGGDSSWPSSYFYFPGDDRAFRRKGLPSKIRVQFVDEAGLPNGAMSPVLDLGYVAAPSGFGVAGDGAWNKQDQRWYYGWTLKPNAAHSNFVPMIAGGPAPSLPVTCYCTKGWDCFSTLAECENPTNTPGVRNQCESQQLEFARRCSPGCANYNSSATDCREDNGDFAAYDAAILPQVEAQKGRTWLVFNEPDGLHQAYLEPRKAAQVYDHLYSKIKAVDDQALLYCCGTSPAMYGSDWMGEFAKHVTKPLDGIHVHNYAPHEKVWVDTARTKQAMIDFSDLMKNRQTKGGQSLGDLNIVVTEWAGLLNETNLPNFQELNFHNVMRPIANWLSTEGQSKYRYQGASWFIGASDAYPTVLYSNTGAPYPLGQEYRTFRWGYSINRIPYLPGTFALDPSTNRHVDALAGHYADGMRHMYVYKGPNVYAYKCPSANSGEHPCYPSHTTTLSEMLGLGNVADPNGAWNPRPPTESVDTVSMAHIRGGLHVYTVKGNRIWSSRFENGVSTAMNTQTLHEMVSLIDHQERWTTSFISQPEEQTRITGMFHFTKPDGATRVFVLKGADVWTYECRSDPNVYYYCEALYNTTVTQYFGGVARQDQFAEPLPSSIDTMVQFFENDLLKAVVVKANKVWEFAGKPGSQFAVTDQYSF